MRTHGRCNWQHKVGWWCSRDKAHAGPCALRRRWWNIHPMYWGHPL